MMIFVGVVETMTQVWVKEKNNEWLFLKSVCVTRYSFLG
jgi:hypothetical protein